MSQFIAPRPVLNTKPRNPWVPLARIRKAGAHGQTSERQTRQRELARQLRELWTPPRTT